jgi:hypothetical protein
MTEVLSRYFSVPYHTVVLQLAGESNGQFVLCFACLERVVINLSLFKYTFNNIFKKPCQHYLSLSLDEGNSDSV